MAAARLAPQPERCTDGHAEYEVMRREPGLLRVRCLYCQHPWAIAFESTPPKEKEER